MNSTIFKNFHEAGQAVLKFLHQKFGFSLWMITRVEGNDWIVLQSEDHGYGVKPGRVFNWADSFCSHMVLGNAPRIAPCSDDVALYASAPIAKKVTIKAYIGQPLLKEDGSLFGTLCAIDPQPQSREIVQDGMLVELFGNLLSHILQHEIREHEQIRLHERLLTEALMDSMTGVYNRRGWNKFIEVEELRCQQYGHPAAIIVVDLNSLKKVNDVYGHAEGDRVITQAASILKNAIRSNDLIARLGGDEFAILVVDLDAAQLEQLKNRLLNQLEKAGISAAIGFEMRHPSYGLTHALEAADQKMYTHKRKLKYS